MIFKELGVGVIYNSGLDPWIQAGIDMIDVIEVEPQTHWLRSEANNQIRFQLNHDLFLRLQDIALPKIFHSVGFPVGGAELAFNSQASALNKSIELLNPLWISEHLNFNQVPYPSKFFTNFLLPPLQNEKSLEIIIKNIKTIKKEVGLPFLFEIGANYLKPQPDEIADGIFFSTIAKEADCGILLDLHNVWANQKNQRQSIDSLMKTLPLERIYEIHLAAGSYHKGYWIDAHCGLIQDELFEIAQKIIPALPQLKAINFEMVPEYIGRDNISEKDFLLQLEKMRLLWSSRNTDNSTFFNKVVKRRKLSNINNKTELIDWQNQLGAKVINYNESDIDDPGIKIYQDLIASVRGGLLISALPLTTRYLRLSKSEEFFKDIVYEFWNSYTPEPYGSDEALNFGFFINSKKQLFVRFLRVVYIKTTEIKKIC